MGRGLGFSFVLAPLFGLVAAPTLAQSAVPAAGATSVTQVEDIVVTATRVERSLQQVPISVGVIGGTEIERSGSFNFADVGLSSANLATGLSGNNPNISTISVRGITGRTAVYIDDVIVGDPQANNSTLLDVDRIEVLRGPQGTTFGANTIAGAINIITKRPSFTWTGEGNALLGNYGSQNYRAFVSGPIVPDAVAFKLSGFARSLDGYDTSFSGKKYNGDNEKGFRASVLLRPASAVDVLIAYDYAKLDIRNGFVPNLFSAPPGTLVNALTAAGQLPANADPFARRVFDTTDENRIQRTNQGVSGRIDVDLGGDARLVSVTAYREVTTFLHKDEDYLPAFYAFSDSGSSQSQFSQEFRLSAKLGRANLLAGAYYLDNRIRSDLTIPLGPDYLTLLGFPPFLASGGALFAGSIDIRRTRSFAVFGSAELPLTDRLSLTLGGRFTTERLRGQSGQITPNIAGLLVGTLVRPQFPLFTFPDVKTERVDPAASLLYRITPDINIYASIGTGFRSPNFNGLQACQAPTNAVPCLIRTETATSYEVGFKSQLFDRRLRFNVTAYHFDLRDFQVGQSIPQAAGPNLDALVNTRVKSTGFEAELLARLSRAFSIDATLGYGNARYGSYPNAQLINNAGSTTGCTASILPPGQCVGDATGFTLPFAPKWTGAVGATYEGELGSALDWFARGEYQFRSRSQNALGDLTVNQVSAINLVNLALGLSQSGGKGFGATFRVRNLFNAQYITNAALLATGETYVNVSTPRTISGEISFKF